MSEGDRRAKEKEFGELSGNSSAAREFREDLNLRQNEENAAVIEKANKAIKQIAEAEKYDLVLQDVVWVSPRLDITDKVIKALSEASDARARRRRPFAASISPPAWAAMLGTVAETRVVQAPLAGRAGGNRL